MFEEPSSNITQFLVDILVNDRIKLLKEFCVSSEEYNFKFDPSTTDLPEEIQYQCPILNASIYYKAHKCFTYLIDSGAKLNGTDSWLCGPAHIACQCGRLEMLSDAKLSSINFEAKDWKGRSPIHYAAEYDHLDCLRFLVENKNVNLNIKDKFGMTPYHIACAYGSIDIIEYLIEKGSEWTVDSLNRTPLEVAVEKGNIEVLRFFASRNETAIIESETSGRSLAHIAAINGFDEEVEFLSTIQSFDFNKLDKLGMSPLHYAAEHDQVKVITTLLKNESVNQNITNPNGKQALHFAAEYGKVRAIDSLVHTNPKLNNPVDNDGCTPLYLASANGHLYAVQVLIDAGADKEIKTKEGRNPHDVAHGTYAKNIQNAIDGIKQNCGDLCKPNVYPVTNEKDETTQKESQLPCIIA